MVFKHKYMGGGLIIKKEENTPPEKGVYEGGNSLSKCSFCCRRIPKDILRHTKKGGYYKDNHNVCASCLIIMVKVIIKKKGQKRLITEWDRVEFLKVLVGEE